MTDKVSGRGGAGTVIVWDTGAYDNLDDEPVATGDRRRKPATTEPGSVLSGRRNSDL